MDNSRSGNHHGRDEIYPNDDRFVYLGQWFQRPSSHDAASH